MSALSMKTGWVRVKKCLYCIIGIAMVVQMVFSFVWMVKNFNTVPGFGDTGEYIGLSESLALDEYRPILYPLVLRVARKISPEHFYHYVYVFQTLLSFGSMCYAVFAIDSVVTIRSERNKNNVFFWVFGGLYLTSIPMITWFNFTILTDSMATSLLVVMLSAVIQVIYKGDLSLRNGIIIALSLIGQSLTRSERFYSEVAIIFVFATMALLRNPKRRRIIALGTACILVISVCFVSVVKSKTQIKGRNGRADTSLSFIMLDRIVNPHMTENYQYFPQEIRDNITLEDAEYFDTHNNSVMYQMAPLLEGKVGKAKAEEYYRTMAKIVWEHSSKAIISDVGDTILHIMVTPLMHYLALKSIYHRSNVGWNVHCLSSSTPELTLRYDIISFYILLLTIGIAIIILIGNLIQHTHRKGPFVLLPYFMQGAVTCLGFSLFSGAPANDRYMLIFYVAYALFSLWVFSNDELNGTFPFPMPENQMTAAE